MARYAYPPAMRRLVNELSKLPSIGEKSAVRLAYHLLTHEAGEALELAAAIKEAREQTRLCHSCFALTDSDLCEICSDPERSRFVICVVEKPADVIAIERSNSYHGLYHVLHGLWAPLRGISPEMTKLPELLKRLENSQQSNNSECPRVSELILATSTTVEGDATALYIAQAMAKFKVNISRIAQGLPKGGELEYADELTLSHAMEGRKSF